MRVAWDGSANAAYIYFSDIPPGGSKESLAVKDRNGEVVGVLDFSADGELLGIELLNANVQMPKDFRK
jgi:uncharacterized protein YuzE